MYGNIAVKAIPTAHLLVTDFTSDGFGKAHSLPNKLSVRGDEPLITEQASMLIYFTNPVEGVNFWLTSGIQKVYTQIGFICNGNTTKDLTKCRLSF